MPRSHVPITNFTSGEFDPKLRGRSDVEQYRNGAKELTNVVVEWFGGAVKTPGTKYVGEVKTSSSATRLIPFVFSNVETYVLEFGDNYIRFYKDHEQIEYIGSAYEVATTYSASEVFDIQYVQTADVLYLFHPDHHPAQLVRSGDTDWTLSDIAFEWGPWLPMNTSAITMDAGAVTGTDIALVASANFFVAGHVGAFFKMHSGYMEVTAVTDAQNAIVDIKDDLTAHTATADWYEGAFSTYRGFPRCGAFYEDRLAMAATDHEPNTLWLSEPGAYEQFEGGSDDDDAITETINAKRLNIFRWIEPGDVLLIGNEGGIVKYWSGSDSSPLTPSSKNAKKTVEEGTANVLPVTIGSQVYYVARDGKIIRTIKYSLEDDKSHGADVTLFSRSLITDQVTQMAYQQAPHSILWIVTDDGGLTSATIDQSQKIIAFTHQSDDGLYKSVASIPKTGYDELWFIVERTIDGSTKKYIEYMTQFDVADQEDQFFVRSGITATNSPASTTVSGLDHLEGETVSVLADGFVQPDETVVNGSITIDRAASTIQAGLGYTSVIETLNLDAGAAIGSAINKYKIINQCYVHLYKTGAGVKIGTSSQMDTVQFDQPSTLYTGYKSVRFPQGFTREKTVRITQENPLPLSVNAIYPDMYTND